MTEVFKLFLGANDKRADTPELRILGDIASSQGFHLFGDTSDFKNYCTKILPGGFEEVIIRGGQAECCVATAIDYLLKEGINVSVDIPNIRCGDSYWDKNVYSRQARIITYMEEDSGPVNFLS